MNRRLLVDLEALAANYSLFLRAGAGAAVGAVVKADAYGIGAQRAITRLQAAGCRSYFVATLEEAVALKPVLGEGDELFVFEGVDASNALEAAAASLIPVLNHEQQLEAWRPHADQPAALHFDTGMSRLGFSPNVDPALFSDFNLNLITTHLACADEPDHPRNSVQIQRFADICRHFPGLRSSIGNSAGWLSGEATRGELGRPGIGLYGGNPFVDRASPVAPVAALQGRVLQTKELAAGETVGYGASCVLEKATRVAIVGIGYADGLPRHLSGRGVLALGGQRCPILGRVSMDMTVIDLTGVPEVEVGDWAECFGATIDVNEAAGSADTIAYEILTGIGARVPRIVQPLG